MTLAAPSPKTPRPIGEVLRCLRLEGNLSQLDLATRMGFPASTVSLVERGEQAPTPQYVEKFAIALGLSGREIGKLWIMYRHEPGAGVSDSVHRPNRADCPFRGLSAFREEDAPFFHGRQVVVKRLLSEVAHTNLAGIVGASGSGKSSVVFAGLIPALRIQDDWLIVTFRPSADPYESMAFVLSEIVDSGASIVTSARQTAELTNALRDNGIGPVVGQVSRRLGRPILLFVDQFEELFTHCHDGQAAQTFLNGIADLTERHVGGAAQIKLLLTLRGDFYGRVVGHRRFSDALQDHVVHLPPMTRDELRHAITEPTRVKGVRLESGLVDRILDDVGNEPGNLPLLQFALTLLWERQEAGVLTQTAYEKIGKVSGAIATQAEDAYFSLAPEQQDTARRLLTRLVRVARPGEDGDDARRRTPLSEVAGLARVDRVIGALTDARLLVTDADESDNCTVEVAHEAIIRSWSRLRAWLDEDRQFLLWQQRVRQWYQEWKENSDDEAAILRGRILTEAETWIAARGEAAISANLLEFISHSADVRRADGDRLAVARIGVLLSTKCQELPAIIDSFAGHESVVHARICELLAEVDNSADDANLQKSWRLRLALASSDRDQAIWLIDHLEIPDPDEIVVAREILRSHSNALSEPLWKIACSLGTRGTQKTFRAAVMLAEYTPDDARWARIATALATELVEQNQLYLRTWLDALRPVVDILLDPLVKLVADTTTRDTIREAAVSLVQEISGNRGSILAQIICDGPSQTYASSFTTLAALGDSNHKERSAGINSLRSIAQNRSIVSETELERVRQGRRRGIAACTLLRLGVSDGILDLLGPDPDPEMATQFAHRARPYGLSADLIAALIGEAPTARARYVMLMALGAYPPKEFSGEATFRRTHTKILDLHSSDDDAGVHSACEWVDRRWGHRLKDVVEWRPFDPTGSRTWFTVFVSGVYLTFSILQPGKFLMGSPETEAERSDYESPLQPTAITCPFALCTQQVTRGEFENFMAATDTTGLPNIDEWSPSRREPIVAATWCEATDYCRWATDSIGQQKISSLRKLNNPVDWPDWWVFRLPTEAEWEYACRADTITAYSFGSDRTFLDEYGWSASNSGLRTHEAGILRPNPAGIFNIHGQCWEWCSDWYGPYSSEPVIDPTGPEKGDRRVLRGGCWNLGDRYSRSACRNAHIPPNRNYYISFRLAVTVPSAHPDGAGGENPLLWSG